MSWVQPDSVSSMEGDPATTNACVPLSSSGRPVDRWGFFIDPNAENKAEQEAREMQEEASSEAWWKQVAQDWSAYHGKKLPQLQHSVATRGVPHSMRRIIWQLMVGVEEVKKAYKHDYFQVKPVGCLVSVYFFLSLYFKTL